MAIGLGVPDAVWALSYAVNCQRESCSRNTFSLNGVLSLVTDMFRWAPPLIAFLRKMSSLSYGVSPWGKYTAAGGMDFPTL